MFILHGPPIANRIARPVPRDTLSGLAGELARSVSEDLNVVVAERALVMVTTMNLPSSNT